VTVEGAFYQREGLLVEAYDALQPDLGDVPFYAELARETGGPILELACGTGRVLWPLAEAGFEVVGLDRSRPMLRRAEAKRTEHAPEVAARVRLVGGDMTSFRLEERFGLVFIAFRSFQALLTPQDEREALRRVHEHLRPGGRLALHVFDPRLEWCVAGEVEPPFRGRTGAMPDTGHEVRIDVMTHVNDPLRQVLTERWRLREIDASGTVRREEEEVLQMRWLYRWEVHYLLECCGFRVEAEYADFEKSPPAYGGDQIWVARRD
jgi:SAM-dependent methyltransferase